MNLSWQQHQQILTQPPPCHKRDHHRGSADPTSFSDEEVGAAARYSHGGQKY
ncbi:hypothetical protein OK016_16900 [Vibrio chagasii]|nr:hypothetical protein [Vibrio chagasii]